jgi:UDP-N-acetylglucosamine diphosphorylase / glucose-1-phosphate thymidylyltransferase / UDP-N-acetylgalactosamine diphosphorylase / glucosamine-1-phosphate N-acetyltransferase / galactosamine-1-phosphate N-acetyltransferase
VIPRIAVLLAAGPGRRFWPYSVIRNKAAFPILNRPLVRRMADSVLELGVRELRVVLGAHPGSVRAALTGLEDQTRFYTQSTPGGSADAALHALDGCDEPSLIVAADVVTAPENLRALCTEFAAAKPEAAFLAHPLGSEAAGDWITCSITGDQVRDFAGHGRGGTHRWCGISLLTPSAVSALQRNPGLMTHVPVGGMPALEAEVAETLASMMDEGRFVLPVETVGTFVDVDKPWHILEASQGLIADETPRVENDVVAEGCAISDDLEISGKLILEPGARIGRRVVVKGNLWLGRNAEVTNGAILGGSVVIGAESRVRDYAFVGGSSVIGARCIVGHGAEFDGLLLDGAYLYHYCEISGVLGAAVDIGAATVCGTLRFDDANTTHVVQGHREVPLHGSNESYLGDYSRTGVNAILMPGVKVGAYSCVGAGVVLYEDLPSRELVLVRQELVRKPWGPERYGW